ncbi:prepilin peptidase [Candidatus Woesearchaeota archaeon]|nr:prepilin peptidase [Candidatus Woesearchaeota archaeon]
MVFSTIALGACLLALAAGSYTDIRTREVPDWVNFALILFGIGTAAIASAVLGSYVPLWRSALGFGVFLIAALVMFYAGQWGGGDSKMLMGLGAAIGLDLALDSFLVGFFINTLFAGSLYGLVYSLVLAARRREEFWRHARSINARRDATIVRRILFATCALLLIISVFLALPLQKLLVAIVALIVLLAYYLFVFVKAVELACMYREVAPERLTEGDWIADDVVVDGAVVAGPGDLGIGKGQIARLVSLKKAKKVTVVRIKEGIPFVPSFLIGFVATVLFGNILFLLIPL